MYDKPLDPKRTKFFLRDNSDKKYYGSPIQLFLVDMDYEDNDDVREVNHPDFEKYFENVCENSFQAITDELLETLRELNIEYTEPDVKLFKNIDEARRWLLSIGMTESDEDPMVGG